MSIDTKWVTLSSELKKCLTSELESNNFLSDESVLPSEAQRQSPCGASECQHFRECWLEYAGIDLSSPEKKLSVIG